MSSDALNARISALGDLATKQEIIAAKQDAINKANERGAQITKEETAAILQKTAAMHAAQQLPNQLQFEQSQIFRDPVEQAVAARMRAEHGADFERHMQSAEAAIIRQNYYLQQTKDVFEGAASGFVKDLVRGVSLMDAIANAAGRIGDKLIDIGLEQSFGGLRSLLQSGARVGGGAVGGLGGIFTSGGGSGGGGGDWRNAFAQMPFPDRIKQGFEDASSGWRKMVHESGDAWEGSTKNAGLGFTSDVDTSGGNFYVKTDNAAGSVAGAVASLGSAINSGGGSGGGGSGGGLFGGLFSGGAGASSILGPLTMIGGIGLQPCIARTSSRRTESRRAKASHRAWLANIRSAV